MSRVAVQWIRNAEGDWDPIGVWFGTKSSLQSRYLPGKGVDGFFSRVHESISPPVLDDGSRGDWTDTIPYFLDALSNGYDMMVSEVPPEATVDATYAKWVLGLNDETAARWKPRTVAAVTVIPTLDLRVSDSPPSESGAGPHA